MVREHFKITFFLDPRGQTDFNVLVKSLIDYTQRVFTLHYDKSIAASSHFL